LLGGLVLALVLVLLERAARMVNFDPLKGFKANYWVPRIFVGIGLGLAAMLVYHILAHSKYLLPPAASEHGRDIDQLMAITIAVTGVAFVATQILLFFYTFKYRGREGRKALYYPDNHKLELLWTVIPAFGLAAMIIPGLKYWDNITSPDPSKNQNDIAIIAEQFQWTARYPGPDDKLGEYNYMHLGPQNTAGIDTTDKNGSDDFLMKEVHIPKGQQTTFHIRAKDVLHGFWLPHFRANIYAVPGMPTSFTMTPNITTEEARKEYGKPEFNFELACSQLCGSSHYNMRMVVVVDTPEDYQKWLDEQIAKNSSDEGEVDDNPGAGEGEQIEREVEAAEEDEVAAL
jgi:cytochrome c oxidase subunit 2